MARLKKILYVEDDLDIQAIAKIALEDIGGFKVEICSSGIEAVELVEAFEPNILVLDVMMPVLDGPQTLSEIRKIKGFETMPAIFLTANVQPSEVSFLKEKGATLVISKPFDPMTLAEQIKAVL